MALNTRLLLTPVLQRQPKSEKEWTQFMNELAKFVLRVAKLGDGSLTTSGGTTIDGLGEMPGQVPSERSIPMIIVGNKGSAQSTTVLTSTDAGATASIAVAAHNLQTPTGDIAYNSGSVTGLTHNTAYYVYTDDDYAGGAVTYMATTDTGDLVGNVDRYFVGGITTSLSGSTGNIADITNGATTLIEMSAAHGWSTGNTVEISGVVDDGPNGDLSTALNGNQFSITVTSVTEFTVPVNSSGFTNVYASGGTATRIVSDTGGGYGGGGGGGYEIL